MPAKEPPKPRKGWGGRSAKKATGEEEDDDAISGGGGTTGGGGESVMTNQQEGGEEADTAAAADENDDEDGDASSKGTTSMQQERQKMMADYVDEGMVQKLAVAEDVNMDLLGTCVVKDFPGHGLYEGVIVDATDDCGYKFVYPSDGDQEDLYTEELAWVLRESYKWTSKNVEEMEGKETQQGGGGLLAICGQVSSMNGAIDRCTKLAIRALHTHSYWQLKPQGKLAVLRALCEAVAAST